ncbi:hypothetical protein ACEQ8H_006170 [Pleosporales sp. CAS-2024a]
MDDLLPSYQQAISQDPWPLVAHYLPADALSSAALVCHAWHDIMAPQLWGHPASHFGFHNDSVYVALTRFKRLLPLARLSVREWTHTLQLPPAHAEIYAGPHAEWLRDCLEYLPRLQCLLVDGLPFFDHASLMCLRHASLPRSASQPHLCPMFGLRLLDASDCSNATSTGLAEALSHLPNLVSLHLSRTLAARHTMVLSKLKHLPSLRLLALNSLALKDDDFAVVASSIETRVRSLDVSNNNLTDASARALLHYCVKDESTERRFSPRPLSPADPDTDHVDMSMVQSENVVSHVRRKLTGGFAGSLAIERVGNVGITHLYLSQNPITVDGVSGLLRSGRLQVLDIGILPTVMPHAHSHGLRSPSDIFHLPGVSKLTPIFAKHASKKMKYLRINHEIVTEDAPVELATSPRAELNGDSPLLTELPNNSLMTDSHSLTERQTTTQHPPSISIIADTSQIIKRGPLYAPEVVETPRLQGQHSYEGSVIDGPFALLSPVSPEHDNMADRSTSESTAPNRSRTNSFRYIEDRRTCLELRQSQENRLHPSMLPGVRTLVLTDVPLATNRKETFQRIIQYIKDAAEEASIARKRAEYTYALPPGRSRPVAEREHALNLFALQRIVLEMAPPTTTAKKVSSSWRTYPTKSSTEDADSEAFWDAAGQDFSFFGEEECGVPEDEPTRILPLATMSGLELVSDQTVTPLETHQETGVQPEPIFDVVHEIAKFRRERKATYAKLIRIGEAYPDIEGCWLGDVTVVRKSLERASGELDFYGNRYQSGWHYR